MKQPLNVPPLRFDVVVVAAAVAAILQLIIIWILSIPLGVPGEWVWSRIGFESGERAILFLRLFVVVPAGVAYFWYCSAIDRRILTATTCRRATYLFGLMAVGFAWLWVVQESAPAPIHGLGRVPIVHYYPAFSGYFTEARNAADFDAYLANYEVKMAEGDVLHLGTHPPGLIMIHRGLLAICHSSPALVTAIRATRPASVRDTETVLRTLPTDGSPSLSDADAAALWAAGLLAQLAGAATVVPLFGLVERSLGPIAAWRAAAMWCCVPALAVFLPKSDAILPLFGMAVLAFWHRPAPPDLLRAAAAGVMFWLGMMISLAMLPVAALAGLLTMSSILTATGDDRRRMIFATIRATSVAGAAFVVLTVLFGVVFDLNLVTTWIWNFRNHAGFYEIYSRTYAFWLLVTPLELALAVGLPVVVAVIAGGRLTGSMQRLLPVLGVIAMLWLSGKNSGETARLWLLLMPWLLWLAASVWQNERDGRRWRAIFALQLVVGFLTAVRVSGFGFDAYLTGGM